MESFVGLAGVIDTHEAQAITVKSIQADVQDPAASDVLVTLSGTLGTSYSFSAVAPIVSDLRFGYGEDINVTSTGSLTNLVINYIKRGDMSTYMVEDPIRVTRLLPGKWDIN